MNNDTNATVEITFDIFEIDFLFEKANEAQYEKGLIRKITNKKFIKYGSNKVKFIFNPC